jgi:magnesium-protoporphyrin O-methyltransferase
MDSVNYEQRRGELEHYFDRTAAATWARLTSDAPVGRIRQTVRAGRDNMRDTLLSWLPEDLSGRRLLDAGCGTGALAIEAAQRGAEVVAIDLSPTLVELARERLGHQPGAERVRFMVGDMRQLELDSFDHAVAMDSLIHYPDAEILGSLALMAERVRESILFTFAPRTPLLGVMHSVGRFFPRGNRAPAIEPVAEQRLWQRLDTAPELQGWQRGRSLRVASGFYTSQACELVRE